MSLEAAKIPNESNQNPRPNDQVRGDPYVDKSPQRKSRNVPSLITTLSVKRNMMKSQTQQVRGDHIGGSESTQRCVLTPEHVEEDKRGTERPVLVDHKEEHEIAFRVSGLPHAVVKEAELLRVQELVKKIENHPHREALQADLQQNNVYNAFSDDAKTMIRELGNVELFELCETLPKVQRSHCLVFWNQGIVYCTCGQCLIDSESRRKFNKLRLDALSTPHYVIKKGRRHGARHGKTEEQKIHMAWNAWKRCCKKVDSQGEHFTGVQDRFFRGPVYRESQFAVGWTEQKCKEWDELAQGDHTYRLTAEEKKRYQGQWYLTLDKAGKNGPMKLRSDFRAAVSMKKSSTPRIRRTS